MNRTANTPLSVMKKAVRAIRLADLPVSQALKVLADMPEAKGFQLSPETLCRILHESLPAQYASVLFQKAGYRVKLPLADLAYLAPRDQTLTDLVTTVILWLDRE